MSVLLHGGSVSGQQNGLLSGNERKVRIEPKGESAAYILGPPGSKEPSRVDSSPRRDHRVAHRLGIVASINDTGIREREGHRLRCCISVGLAGRALFRQEVHVSWLAPEPSLVRQTRRPQCCGCWPGGACSCALELVASRVSPGRVDIPCAWQHGPDLLSYGGARALS